LGARPQLNSSFEYASKETLFLERGFSQVPDRWDGFHWDPDVQFHPDRDACE